MSTPIETNTEELQEVLQQVYNLPSRSTGGSVTPDLVVGLITNSSLYKESITEDNISIISGSLQSVFTKLRNGEEAKVILKHDFWYGGANYVGVFYPSGVSSQYFDETNYQIEERVQLDFILNELPGFHGILMRLHMSFKTDGTIYNFTYNSVQG